MLQSEGILHQSWSPEHKTLVCLSAYLFINPHQETEKTISQEISKMIAAIIVLHCIAKPFYQRNV